MRYNRNNNLFFAFLMGGLIGILIRLYRERRQACAAAARPQPPMATPPVIPRTRRHTTELPPHIWN